MPKCSAKKILTSYVKFVGCSYLAIDVHHGFYRYAVYMQYSVFFTMRPTVENKRGETMAHSQIFCNVIGRLCLFTGVVILQPVSVWLTCLCSGLSRPGVKGLKLVVCNNLLPLLT